MKKTATSFYQIIKSAISSLWPNKTFNDSHQEALSEYDSHFLKCITDGNFELAKNFLDSKFTISQSLGRKINQLIINGFTEISTTSKFSFELDNKQARLLKFICDHQLFTEETLPFLIHNVKNKNFLVSSMDTLFRVSSPNPTLFSLNAGLYRINNTGSGRAPVAPNSPFSFKQKFYEKNLDGKSLELFDIYYDQDLISSSTEFLLSLEKDSNFINKLKSHLPYRSYPILNFPEVKRDPIKVTAYGSSLLNLLPSIIDYQVNHLKMNPYQLFKDSLLTSNSITDLEDYSVFSIYLFKRFQQDIELHLTPGDVESFTTLLKKTIPLFSTNVNSTHLEEHINNFSKSYQSIKNLDEHHELLQKFKKENSVFNFYDYAQENNLLDSSIHTIHKIFILHSKLKDSNKLNMEELSFLESTPKTIKKIIDDYVDLRELLGLDNSSVENLNLMLNKISENIENIFNSQQQDSIEQLVLKKNKVIKHT